MTVHVPEPATFLGIVRADGRVATRNRAGGDPRPDGYGGGARAEVGVRAALTGGEQYQQGGG